MDRYGLVGKNIGYSFSGKYFSEKFTSEKISAEYLLFDIEDISELKKILKTPNLKGLNVTIPYKETVIPFLDEIDLEAKEIGAVNTIKIRNGLLTGYNTDVFGFVESISPLLENHHKKALVFGTGGASKAVVYGLEKLGIEFKIVSRKASENQLTYKGLSKEILQTHKIIVNCTPLGTFPEIDTFPDIPYRYIDESHLLFDLTYNPSLTKFLELGRKQGAKTENGLNMLKYQAEKAWGIWVGG